MTFARDYEPRVSTSVFFTWVDPRKRLEFFGWGEVFYGVELELGFKVFNWREKMHITVKMQVLIK